MAQKAILITISILILLVNVVNTAPNKGKKMFFIDRMRSVEPYFLEIAGQNK